MRGSALAAKKATFKYKKASMYGGFALIDTTDEKLKDVLHKDPFTKHFLSVFNQAFLEGEKASYHYSKITEGQEFTKISDYLKLSSYFQSVMEPAVGVSIRLPGNEVGLY